MAEILVIQARKLVDFFIQQADDATAGLTADDRALLEDINASGVDCAALIGAYYRDLDRAHRTPRPFLYLHLGMVLGLVDRLEAER